MIPCIMFEGDKLKRMRKYIWMEMICVEREELICSINLRGYFNLNSSTWKFTKNYNMKKHIIPCGEDVSIKNSQKLTTNFLCDERNE